MLLIHNLYIKCDSTSRNAVGVDGNEVEVDGQNF
jgi:hypothetical protein